MQRSFRVVLLIAVMAVLGIVPSAQAQSDKAFRFADLFKSKQAAAPAPAPKYAPQQQQQIVVQGQPENPNRVLEVLVELAWLEDPATFPYYMEARVQGSVMQVRGNVPSRQIREHALKVAQLHCPLSLVDNIKENPNLQAKPRRISASQLFAAAQTSLREALPRHHQNLKVKVNAEGRVAVTGSVPTFEHKLAVSQSLRRLHGCTGVSNLLEVASDPGGQLARQVVAKNNPIQGTLTSTPGAQTQYVSKPPQGQPTPPTQGVVITPNGAPGNGQTPSQAQVRKKIEDASRGAKGVQVKFTSPTDVRVEVVVGRVEDGDQVVGQIFSLQELSAYRVDMHVQVLEPTNTNK